MGCETCGAVFRVLLTNENGRRLMAAVFTHEIDLGPSGMIFQFPGGSDTDIIQSDNLVAFHQPSAKRGVGEDPRYDSTVRCVLEIGPQRIAMIEVAAVRRGRDRTIIEIGSVRTPAVGAGLSRSRSGTRLIPRANAYSIQRISSIDKKIIGKCRKYTKYATTY